MKKKSGKDKVNKESLKSKLDHSSKLRILLLVFMDISFCAASYWLARSIMFSGIAPPGPYERVEIVMMLLLIVTVVGMLAVFDCYRSVWKYAGRVEFFKFLLSFIASFVVIIIYKIIAHFALHVEIWSPLMLMYLLFTALTTGAVRYITAITHYIKHLVKVVTQGKLAGGIKRTVVIGAGYTGSLAINRFINNPQEGYFPVALVDDDPVKHGMKIYGVKVLGGTDDLANIIKTTNAEAIIIAIMFLTKSQLKNIYMKCASFNLPIKILPTITNASEISNATLSFRDIKIEELLGREEFTVNRDMIDSAVKDKVVCVTGGAGSIGSELCRQALKFGCKHLVIFDMHENGMFEINEEFSKIYDTSRYSLVVGTVRERSKVRDTFEKYKPEIVFHAAAYKHVPMMEISGTEAIKNNVFGTRNVIDQCEESGVKKFVLISTDKAVNPANIMGASKRIAEMLIQTRGKNSPVQMAAVRFGNVLGSNGSVIPTFLKQIRAGGPITLTHRDIKRYFMSIPEAVRLVLQAGALAKAGEVFVLDMGEPVYIYDLACDLIRINGYVPNEDIEIKVTGLRAGEKLFEELRFDNEMVDTTVHEGIFANKLNDIDKPTFDKQLAKLKEVADSENKEAMEKEIFTLVPSEYRAK